MNAATIVCLHSAELFNTPGMLRYAIALYATHPEDAIRCFQMGFGLTRKCAEGLVSGRIRYKVEDGKVIFKSVGRCAATPRKVAVSKKGGAR